MFYTYLWLRENGTPYYVGKGAGDRAYVRHLIGKCPSKDRILLQEFPTEQDAFVAEVFLIAYYGRIDLGTGCLRNLTDGGDGTSGHVLSEESKEKMSIANKGKVPWMKGKKHSEESKNKNRESCRGRIPWNKGTKTKEITCGHTDRAHGGHGLCKPCYLHQYYVKRYTEGSATAEE